MTFFPDAGRRLVPSSGAKISRMAVIGEAPGREEERLMRPFVGPAGSVFEQCAHAGGVTRAELYITNLVKHYVVKTPKLDGMDEFYLSNNRPPRFTAKGLEWVQQLWEELADTQANILVPLGKPAMHALIPRWHLIDAKHTVGARGYIFQVPEVHHGLRIPPGLVGRKVLPSIHPSAALRGQYIWRYYIGKDLEKAKLNSHTRELVRPKRTIITPTSLSEVLEWIKVFKLTPLVSVDIEVMNYCISCLGLSCDPTIGISIPLYDNWTELQEIEILLAIQSLLNLPIEFVFQNGIFDTHFLWTRYGIRVRGPFHEHIQDTMIGHSIVYPDMLKGLNFLGSLYCGTQELWKDMIRFDNIKEES